MKVPWRFVEESSEIAHSKSMGFRRIFREVAGTTVCVFTDNQFNSVSLSCFSYLFSFIYAFSYYSIIIITKNYYKSGGYKQTNTHTIHINR